MMKGFPNERQSASAFLQRVIRPGIDQSAVVSFSTHMAMESESDASSPASLQRVGNLQSAGLTALFDSLCQAAALFTAQNSGPASTRRVLVLLSDGDDTYSVRSLADAIEAAQKSDVVIYAITAHDPREAHWGDANLARLTEATGGRVFFLKNYDQSGKVFAEIEQEIRSQYAVTFPARGDTCGFHRLGLEPADRSWRVRSRTGFHGDCM